MNGSVIIIILLILFPVFLIVWNRQRCKGKMLCLILKKDKSLDVKLCQLQSDFVIYEDRAFDVYPDFIRLARFPMGWPAMLQELVPASLYLEEDAVPLNWIDLDKRHVRSMELKAALSENFFGKLVHETVSEVGGKGFNWKKVLPILLLIVGLGGLAVIFILNKGSCAGVPATQGFIDILVRMV